MAPFYKDEPTSEGSGLFLHLNTNKSSRRHWTSRRPAGKGRPAALVRDADIVVESFTPGVMPSLDLDYERLRGVNPTLVMTSISNFGQHGALQRLQAERDHAVRPRRHDELTGLPDREPVKLGLTVEQFYAGMVCATATMGAFMGASLTGEGQHVDMSLIEIMVATRTAPCRAT